MPNRVRYDGRRGRFYEVWYFILHDPATGDGYWVRYTLLNPQEDHPAAGAALWFAHTCRADPGRSLAIHAVVPRGSFEANAGEPAIRIGDAEFREGAARGRFEAEGHRVAWDLRYEPSASPHYYFGPLLRRWSESRTSVTIPNPAIRLTGSVEIDGVRRDIASAPGHQAHHWGTTRTRRWLWGHCCAFDDEPAVLEVLAPALPVGPTVTFVDLHTASERFSCNDFGGLLRNRSTAGRGFWQFEGFGEGHRIVADFVVDPSRVQRFEYTSPAYRTSECWNTQVADCTVRVYRHSASGDRLDRVLHARGTATAEVHDEDPSGIPYAREASPPGRSEKEQR